MTGSQSLAVGISVADIMNSIIYLVGLVVIILAILNLIGMA